MHLERVKTPPRISRKTFLWRRWHFLNQGGKPFFYREDRKGCNIKNNKNKKIQNMPAAHSHATPSSSLFLGWNKIVLNKYLIPYMYNAIPTLCLEFSGEVHSTYFPRHIPLFLAFLLLRNTFSDIWNEHFGRTGFNLHPSPWHKLFQHRSWRVEG